MKPDISFVLKSGHFHLLTTLPGWPRPPGADSGASGSQSVPESPGQLARELVELRSRAGDNRTERRRTGGAADNGTNLISVVADHKVQLQNRAAIRCHGRMGRDRHPARAVVIDVVRTASGTPSFCGSDSVVDNMINLRHVPVAVEMGQGNSGNGSGSRRRGKNLTCDREGIVPTKGRVGTRGMLLDRKS